MIFRVGSFLLLMALAMVLCGILFQVAPRLPFLSWMGRLPGDIRIEGERTRFFFPFTSCLVISLILMLALRLLRWILPRF